MSTGQSNAAAERSYHAPEADGAAAGPVVEVSRGVFQLRAIVERDAKIARLRDALERAPAGWSALENVR